MNRSEPGHSLGAAAFPGRGLQKEKHSCEEDRSGYQKYSILLIPTCSICFPKGQNLILAISVPQDFAGWWRQEVRSIALHSAWPNSSNYFAGQGWMQTDSRLLLLLQGLHGLLPLCFMLADSSRNTLVLQVPILVLASKEAFSCFFCPCPSHSTSRLMQPQTA